MRLITKELTNFKIPLDISLISSQTANPGKWSLLLLLCTVVLAPQASGRGLGEATRPLLPVAASSSLCRDFFFALCDFLPSLECSAASSRPQSLRTPGTFSFLVWIQLETVESTVSFQFSF